MKEVLESATNTAQQSVQKTRSIFHRSLVDGAGFKRTATERVTLIAQRLLSTEMQAGPPSYGFWME